MVNFPDKIELDADGALAALDNALESKTGHWRHGYTETVVFEHDNGGFYRATIRFHPEDGAQLCDPIEAYLVVPREKVVTEWVRPK